MATIKETKLRIETAFAEYKEAKGQAKNWREDHMESLAEAMAEKNNTTREKQIQQMRRIEQQRRLARSAKRARGKLGKQRVTKVWFTDEAGEKHEANTKTSMETAITRENIKRFRQTEDTPPMLRQLLYLVGVVGEESAIELILQGYPIWEGMGFSEYTKEFFQAMKCPDRIIPHSPTQPHLSKEEHSFAWRKQREYTSAEPTAPSFSHFKAAANHSKLAQFDAGMRSLPYCHGFSPKLWQIITDVSILKKEGVYDVEKMRTIQLMHPEFNINNKRLGREVMALAERFEIIPPDQYGSRKQHRCIRAALNKRLTMDIVRQLKIPAALCSNDAKSCYDRIVHWVANVAMQRTGMQAAPMLSMFKTLQAAQHFVSTGYGVAGEGCAACQFLPLQGIGQGNGSGPAVWALISAILLDMMYNAGHFCNLISPITGTKLSFVGYAFVDDTDIVQIGTPWSIGEQLAQQMQIAIDRWEGGLRASGGALVPKKSHWYLIDLEWTGSYWKYRDHQSMKGEVKVTDTDGKTRVPLTRHEISHASETLGVLLSMDGNNSGAERHLRAKAEKIANTAKASPMTHEEAWYMLESSIMKTMEYPMEALSISKERWEWIVAPIMTTILPKAGIDSSFPRSLVYGLPKQMGLGLMHPWYNQNISHIIAFIEEGLKTRSLTGQHFSQSFENLLMEAGLEGKLFLRNYHKIAAAITPCWLTHMWEFMWDHKI